MQLQANARNRVRRPPRVVVVFATLLAAALGVASCGQQRGAPEPPPVERPRPGGTFVMAQDAPDRLDPACVDDVYEATLVNQIFDGLLSFDTHLNTIPCVASSWVISAGGTEYTFNIRRGVRFHDGMPVTADDVVYSLQRVFDLPVEDAGLAREYLCHILGTQDYVSGKEKSIRGLEVVSPEVVRIRLSQPYASFLAVLASELARIVPKHVVEHVGTAEFARHPVGCGPFKFDRWEPQRIVLTRFQDYARGPVYLDSLVFELPAENSRDYALSGLFQGSISAAVVPDGRLSELQGGRDRPVDPASRAQPELHRIEPEPGTVRRRACPAGVRARNRPGGTGPLPDRGPDPPERHPPTRLARLHAGEQATPARSRSGDDSSWPRRATRTAKASRRSSTHRRIRAIKRSSCSKRSAPRSPVSGSISGAKCSDGASSAID